MFKKIKSLFSKSSTTLDETLNKSNHTSVVGDNPPQDEPISNQIDATQSYPITNQIMMWLNKQEWKYNHRSSDESGIHHIIMGFADREHEWTCVFRINEHNQLVTMFGILEESVPISHYTAMLMEIAKINLNVSFGNIEFDPVDGEVRAKIAFDVEFNTLNDKSLGCYLQAVAGLTEVARNVMRVVMIDDEPSQFVGDYIDVDDEIKAMVDDEKRTFFLPTHIAQ